MCDLTFSMGNGRFNYRVAAIIINNGQLLMVKSSLDEYYYSVGGRVKINETTENAILREVKEETGINFEIDRLGFVHENFFIEQTTKEKFHELGFFYYMKLNLMANLINKTFSESSGIEESLVWLPLNNLENINLYPEFFKTELLMPKPYPQHIVTDERVLKLK